jgi:hypothetical protein
VSTDSIKFLILRQEIGFKALIKMSKEKESSNPHFQAEIIGKWEDAWHEAE